MSRLYHAHGCVACPREIRHPGRRASCPDPPIYAACAEHRERPLVGFNREGHVPMEPQGNEERLTTLETMGP